jgi:hypothetical protein
VKHLGTTHAFGWKVREHREVVHATTRIQCFYQNGSHRITTVMNFLQAQSSDAGEKIDRLPLLMFDRVRKIPFEGCFSEKSCISPNILLLCHNDCKTIITSACVHGVLNKRGRLSPSFIFTPSQIPIIGASILCHPGLMKRSCGLARLVTG